MRLHQMQNFIYSIKNAKFHFHKMIDLDQFNNISQFLFQKYYKHNVHNHDLYIVMINIFENFNIENWKFVFTKFWFKIHKICYTQNFWINLSCKTNKKQTNCMTRTLFFEFHEYWTKNQFLHVKKNTKIFYRLFKNNEKKNKKTYDKTKNHN